MNTLTAALRLSLTGIITTFAALLLLRGVIGLLTWFATGAETSTASKTTPTSPANAGEIGAVSDTRDEELAAIMATLAKMGAVDPKQGGRIRIEEVSS